MKTILFNSALLMACATPLAAGPWFHHEFGELRSYHKDWLNVCDSSGTGPCRAVQYKLRGDGDTFFGESRLALMHLGGTDFVIEVYDRGLNPLPEGDLVFDFGSEKVVLAPTKWHAGGADLVNVAETVAVTDTVEAAKLVELIRKKSRLTVTFVVEDAPIAQADFSLRGSAAALAAIEALKSE